MLSETNSDVLAPEVPNQQSTAQESEIQSDQSANEQEQSDESLNPEELEGESEPTQEELEEAEFEGKKYKVPKEIKGALLRNADYTKKTQEIAEIRRRHEAEQTSFQKLQQEREADFNDHVAVNSLDQEIAKYQKAFNDPSWQEVIDRDTPRALRAQQEYQALLAQRHQKTQEIAGRQYSRSQQEQQYNAKLEEETKTVLNRDIKGWGTELQSKLVDYAKSQGFDEAVMARAVKGDAVATKVIHKAYMYDQLKLQLAKPKVQVPTAPIKGIKTTNSRANSSVPSDSDSHEDWLKKRNAQVFRKK